MASVGETLANVLGFGLFAVLFLAPLQLVGTYRLRRARALGRERSYVPHADVPWLADRKWAHIRLEGAGFGDQPITIELKLEVWDSPNSAGVAIDAIRCCRLALDRGLKGALPAPSAYFMKSPPEQWPDEVARERLERFIAAEPDAA